MLQQLFVDAYRLISTTGWVHDFRLRSLGARVLSVPNSIDQSSDYFAYISNQPRKHFNRSHSFGTEFPDRVIDNVKTLFRKIERLSVAIEARRAFGNDRKNIRFESVWIRQDFAQRVVPLQGTLKAD